jgi:hypothetical protein
MQPLEIAGFAWHFDLECMPFRCPVAWHSIAIAAVPKRTVDGRRGIVGVHDVPCDLGMGPPRLNQATWHLAFIWQKGKRHQSW